MPFVQESALWALRRFGSNDDMPFLVEMLKHDDECVQKAALKAIEELYLFSWDDVPRNHGKTLLMCLKYDYDIGWAGSKNIRISVDGKTIHIFNDENSAEIRIDDNDEKATLKTSDGRTYDLDIKKENDKLKIYKKLQIYDDMSLSIELLEEWAHDEVILNALKKLGNSDTLPLVRNVLKNDYDQWEVYETACETFEALVDRENISIVQDMLKNGGSGELIVAIGAFKKIGNSNDLPFIREMLKEGNEKVKIAALEILKELGNSDDLSLILKMLKDRDGDVQKALIDGIKTLGIERDLDFLTEGALDQGKDVVLTLETLIALDKRLYYPYNPSKIS